MRRHNVQRFEVPLTLAACMGACFGWELHANAQPERAPDRPTQVETTVTLEPIVVTGTVLPATIEDVGFGATVLTQEQIAARQARHIADLLRQVGGLHVDQAGAGTIGSVYLRGADPNYTVVLIDGVKVNDPANSRGGSVDLSTLDMANVERIEIVRGPMSAVYGSDALAGAVNIMTRRGGSEDERGAEIAVGGDGYRHGLLRAQGMSGGVAYSIGGSSLEDGTAAQGSTVVNRTLRGSLGGAITRRLGVRSTIGYTHGSREAFPEDSGGPSFAVLREMETRDSQEWVAGIEVFPEDSDWFPDLTVQYYDREEHIDSPGVAPGVRDPVGIPPNLSDSRYRRYVLTLLHRSVPVERLAVGIGIEAQAETGRSQGSLSFGGTMVPTDFELDRGAWAPFVEGRYAVSDAWRVHAGVRLDVPSEFDAEPSARAAVSYRVASTDTTFHLSWGEGFKLPSFFALGHPIVGNPDLSPERSRSGEAGITQRLWRERLTLRAAYFATRSHGTIDFQEGPPPQLVNRSEIAAHGMELEADVQATERIHLSSHLTHVRTDIAGTEEELRNRPEWRGGVMVRWQPRATVVVNVDTLFVGRVLDSSIPTGDRSLAPYARMNLAVTWSWAAAPAWRYVAAVDNVFDADYEETVGFPSAGVTPRIGVQAVF